MNLFLTGTDTNVGKTYVGALLVRGSRKAGLDCVGLKPICCGGREDAELLREAADRELDLNDVNPVWLRTPAAPYTAAMIENRAIDLDLVRETVVRVRARHRGVIVEGVGGWLVPIARDYFVRDLAVEIGLPVAVVIANRLGALNHALLTIEAIKAAGLPCAGLILNQAASPDDSIAVATNRAVLEELAGVPILFDITHGQRELELAVG
ncbi:MAG: dethiobiotin synthetase [Chthoniobacter sp.]|nr:dethiobiotin synthetase [Chthoniobacter sp.]